MHQLMQAVSGLKRRAKSKTRPRINITGCGLVFQFYYLYSTRRFNSFFVVRERASTLARF